MEFNKIEEIDSEEGSDTYKSSTKSEISIEKEDAK